MSSVHRHHAMLDRRILLALLAALAICALPACDESSSDPRGPADDASDPLDAAASALDAESFDVSGDDLVTGSSDDESPVYVVVLAGQSNMVGLGAAADLAPGEAEPRTSVRVFAGGQMDLGRVGRWLPLDAHFGANASFFGPELTLGLALERRWPDLEFALVKYSWGGSSLHTDWAVGGPLWSGFLMTVRSALASLRQEGRRPELLGFAWMQGESDAIQREHAVAYRERLVELIVRVRTSLEQPNLAFVAGKIAPIEPWAHHETVNGAIELVAETVSESATFSTAELGRRITQGDPVHYDTDGQRELGRRFAEALIALQRESASYPADFSPIQGERGWVHQAIDGESTEPLTWDGTGFVASAGSARVMAEQVTPGQSGVEIAWIAPRSGTVTASGRVGYAGEGCGDGVDLLLVGPSGTVLWRHESLDADSDDPATFDIRLAVEPWAPLRFRTLPRATSDCDAARWEIDVALPFPKPD